MHWRFDPLFSIKIVHTKYSSQQSETGELVVATPDFTLEPTKETIVHLNALGWVFKSRPGACIVYGEKKFDAEGIASLRSLPTPAHGFVFFLRLNNAALLNETKPFVLESKPELKPNPNLPAYSGRSRLLYFDNRVPLAQSGGEFSLGPTPVDLPQFASALPTKFIFSKPKSAIKELKFTELTPGGKSTTIELDPDTKSATIELAENAYRLEQNPVGDSETIVLTTEKLTGNVLGLIRIFQPTSGWEPMKRFRINFEKA